MEVPCPEHCRATNSDNIDFCEFSCIYGIEKAYASFERFYDPIPVLNWMKQNKAVPIVAIVLYVLMIFAGRAFFEKRERFNWKYTLASWNLFLSLFSLIGMIRTAPGLLHNLMTLSMRDNLCLDPRATYGSGSTGLWTQLFVLSKFPELIDTFFILIHKKKLIFLHWYHHITVLLYCWHSYVTTAPSGIFFMVMNYTVHATMYGYYFLMALKLKPKWFDPMVVTAMQISQMMVGVAVTLAGYYFTEKEGKSCHLTPENNMAAFVMYGSYLFLFLQFFIGRYWQKPSKTKKL